MSIKVLAGFPGVGKSFLKIYFEKNDLGEVSDSDSSFFSWLKPGVRNPDFPENYITHIKERTLDSAFVLVSTHEIIRKALIAHGIEFALIYPERKLKKEYLLRYVTRNSPFEFVSLMNRKWDDFIDEMEAQEGCVKIVLEKGETLRSIAGDVKWAALFPKVATE